MIGGKPCAVRWRRLGAVALAGIVHCRLGWVVKGLALVAMLMLPGQAFAASNCGVSGTHTLCLTAADVLTGSEPITVTNSPNSGTVIFRWVPNGGSATSLMTDYSASPETGDYSFTWPTQKYPDASGLLEAFYASTGNAAVSIPVALANGAFQPSPEDWASYLPPAVWHGSSDAVVAAAGDGASGESIPAALTDSIVGSAPNLFLYLGDVYEEGTYTENYNHYGLSSLDGPGTLWGRLANITQPTLGNHEGPASAAWRDYWHQRPLYTSFTFAGVLFIDLNSEASMKVGSPQYMYVQSVLAGTTPPCVVALWHVPALSGTSINTSKLPMWTLLTDNGGDLVLNGHNHSVGEYVPLNDQLQIPQSGEPTMVQLISGAGGHSLGSGLTGDKRLAWSRGKTAGALYLTLNGSANGGVPTSLGWTFAATDGTLLRTGSRSCSGGAVNQAPVVDAGADQMITLPAGAALAGTVTDDGLPNPPGTVTTTWSQVSGPGTVTVGDAGAVATTASFDTAGTYVLRLTANDGALSTSDDITITVSVAGSLSVSKRAAMHDATDASAYSFAPITAVNNRLYVVFLSTSVGSGTAPPATGVSGAGLSFTEIGAAGGLLYSGSPGVRRIQAWRALVGSGATTGPITISVGGTSTGMDAVLLEFAGMDTSGTNGSGAIVQSATNKASNATALTVTLAAFGSSSNRPVAFLGHRVAEGTTEAAGYTELDDGSHGSPAGGAECEWHASAAENTPSASWATAANAGGFAIEIKASGAGPANQPPAVGAGPNQTITLPASATLDGTVTDDGLPNPPATVTTAWSQVSGPGTVAFGDASAVDTNASFSASGTYVLRLTASDSALSSSDDITVTVNPSGPTNQAPVVNAGPDQTITLPALATLAGTVIDDGLPNPPGSVTTTWSQVSGPGSVTFADANAVATTASFSTSGTYILRLTASDSALSSGDDVTITVNGSGQAALSVVKRATIHDSTDLGSYAFPSITASSNKLYVVFESTSIGTGTAPTVTSVAGAGLTFTEIGPPGGFLYSGGSGVRRMQAWRALVASGGTTGSITLNTDGVSTGMDAVLLEFTGVDTSGSNGSGAIVQSATNKLDNASSLTLTMAPFGSSANRPAAFFSHRVAEVTSEKSGYTELDDASHSSPATGSECEWHASAADTTPTASWATAADAGGLAIEVKAGTLP